MPDLATIDAALADLSSAVTKNAAAQAATIADLRAQLAAVPAAPDYQKQLDEIAAIRALLPA